MGAADFQIRAKGKTAQAAFDAAVNEARYMSGHGGYTGTIAEKHGFTMIGMTLAERADVQKFINTLMDEDDRRISDKWGPAGCVQVAADEFIFFGWASC